jgi:predicted nucleic-acid-binding protein
MRSLDTNVVLRYLLKDIPAQYARAKKLFTKSPLYVSDVVVSEAAFVLEKAVGLERAKVAVLLRFLLATPGLIANDHILGEAVDLFEIRTALSFVDCHAAIEAKIFGSSLYTFDKKLLHQGGHYVLEP